MSIKTFVVIVSVMFLSVFLSACDKRQKIETYEIAFKAAPGREWYQKDMTTKGVRSVLVPGTHRGDIRGYPVDRNPDAGAYEYSSPTCNEDLQRRILPYINETNPDLNWPGDMDWDGLVDYEDYWILGSWWVN